MPSENINAQARRAAVVLTLICLIYAAALVTIVIVDRGRERPEPIAATLNPNCPCSLRDDSAFKDNLEQVKLLFDYSKFHISVYTTLAGFLLTLSASGFVKKWELHRGFLVAAVLVVLAAGVAAGIVAASMPQSTSKLNFWLWRTGPYDWECLTIRGWTHVEHTSFWTAVVLVIGAFFSARMVPPDDWTAAITSQNHSQESGASDRPAA